MQRDGKPIEKFVGGLYEMAENWFPSEKQPDKRPFSHWTEKQGIIGKTST